MTQTSQEWTEPRYGLRMRLEVVDEPVAFSVAGTRFDGSRWLCLSASLRAGELRPRDPDQPPLSFYPLRTPVLSFEDDAAHWEERWVVVEHGAGWIVLHGACLVTEHADPVDHTATKIMVAMYEVPGQVFDALRSLSSQAGYDLVRGASLCEVMDAQLVFERVIHLMKS